MWKIIRVIVFLFLFPAPLLSQVLPKEGANLNYRIIGFSFSSGQKEAPCKLEIAVGNFFSEDSFGHNIVKTTRCDSGKIIAEVPYFGVPYTWRVTNSSINGREVHSPFYHFTTNTIPNVDTCVYRLRVLKNTGSCKGCYVFLDDSKALYDMEGKPVWFLPPVDGINITPRDIKISTRGTITFLFNPPYEVDYNGQVLWKAPSKGIVNGEYNENCHHEFTRLKSGNYMVLGTENVYWKQNSGIPHDYRKEQGNDTLYKKTPFGTLIEYDPSGNVAWSWKSSDYFTASDLVNYVPPAGIQTIDVHENAFFFDEKNKHIYISFKNINRVLKLKYPDGTVLASYGEVYKPGVPERGNGLFCGQHSCNISRDGYLYLYNNNICEEGGLPKLIMMEEPARSNDSLRAKWEYQCMLEGVSKQERKNYRYVSGGSVQELPDRSVFACMNGTYSKLFIVNRQKEEVWQGVAERWNNNNNKWDMVGQYRAFVIDNFNKLARIIWNAAATSN